MMCSTTLKWTLSLKVIITSRLSHESCWERPSWTAQESGLRGGLAVLGTETEAYGFSRSFNYLYPVEESLYNCWATLISFVAEPLVFPIGYKGRGSSSWGGPHVIDSFSLSTAGFTKNHFVSKDLLEFLNEKHPHPWFFFSSSPSWNKNSSIFLGESIWQPRWL